MSMSESESHGRAGLVAFRYLDFSLYELERFFVVAALEMMSVAVGWQVYEITRRPLDLGLVGLAQFLPGIFLFLIAGQAADHYPRQRILQCCWVAFAGISALLLGFTLRGAFSRRLPSQQSRSAGRPPKPDSPGTPAAAVVPLRLPRPAVRRQLSP